jgi:probable phosphoglycerate mutase
VARHGETEWSRQGRHTGRTDIPLADHGRGQAVELGRRLAGHPFALVLTSPLQRAVETCALAGFGDASELSEDLVEWDYGDYEGMTTQAIRQDRPGWSLWADGVPNGETAVQVGQRADRIVARVRGLEGDALCFAHGHLLRVLAARWIGLPAVGGRLLLLGTGSTGIAGWEQEVPAIERWNEPAAPSR